jgi:nucleoside-diphosphate-sugar epimerase
MTRFVAAQLATAHWYDLTAAREDFGYAPVVSPEQGFGQAVAYFRERVEGL